MWSNISTKLMFQLFRDGYWNGIPFDEESKKYFKISARNVNEHYNDEEEFFQQDFTSHDLEPCSDDYLKS